MKTRTEFRQDADALKKILTQYSGEDSCHFCVIAQDNGRHMTTLGGRMDLTGYCVSEAIANLVNNTPDCPEDIIDMIATTAHRMLADMRDNSNKVIPLKKQ